MSAENISDHVLQQLRLIRAENEKLDRELALMRAEFAMFRGLVDLKLDSILSMLSAHTDTLYQVNDNLLGLQRQREGEPGTE